MRVAIGRDVCRGQGKAIDPLNFFEFYKDLYVIFFNYIGSQIKKIYTILIFKQG